jgi:hypothetical protein
LGRPAGILRGPVSQAKVEIVRRGFAALAEQGVEGVIRYFTEDVVIYSGIMDGRVAGLRLFSSWSGALAAARLRE